MSTLPLPLAAFVAGLVSFLSPCVLPLVPGYVSLISGVGVEELKVQEASVLRKVMLNSLAFIAGFSIVFVTLGAISTEVGQLAAQYKAVLARVAGVLIVVFAFAFGWTPCVGPILSVILGFAAAQDSVSKGIFLLTIYSLGLAVPFLLTSLLMERFLKFYGHFRSFMHVIEVLSGGLLIALGLLLVFGKFTVLARYFSALNRFVL